MAEARACATLAFELEARAVLRGRYERALRLQRPQRNLQGWARSSWTTAALAYGASERCVYGARRR